MNTMERQLYDLSTLVHSALITREFNPTVRKEMMELQQQILDIQTPSIITSLQVQKAPIAIEEMIDNDLKNWNLLEKENNLNNSIKTQNNTNSNNNLLLKKENVKNTEVNFLIYNLKNIFFFS